jgi:hypothetical protein
MNGRRICVVRNEIDEGNLRCVFPCRPCELQEIRFDMIAFCLLFLAGTAVGFNFKIFPCDSHSNISVKLAYLKKMSKHFRGNVVSAISVDKER